MAIRTTYSYAHHFKKHHMDLRDYILNTLRPEKKHTLVTSKTYPKGSYIYMPPNKPNHMFELEKGVVKLGSYTVEGQEVCYEILFRNEVFGNLRYLNGQFFEFAKTLTACSVIEYDLTFYKYLIVNDPIVSEWFNKMVIERWCRVETRLFKICTKTPKERVNAIFQELDYEAYNLNGKKIYISSLLSIIDIAHLTGLTRQTVSKLLKPRQRPQTTSLFKSHINITSEKSIK
ncbi:Crp/Fnr family transcriptional regulator [Aquiflexum sp.]|uniref:Crp/Fnr family transcriptional regulator n=1 Tax=Aquiflexum sp. TaxID=1872584 RepID=UPI0035936AEA